MLGDRVFSDRIDVVRIDSMGIYSVPQAGRASTRSSFVPYVALRGKGGLYGLVAVVRSGSIILAGSRRGIATNRAGVGLRLGNKGVMSSVVSATDAFWCAGIARLASERGQRTPGICTGVPSLVACLAIH